MSRTPEQIKADDALTEAITAVERAYHGGTGSILTEYVVIYANRSWDSDGDGCTAIGMMPRDSDVPLHQLLGLAEYATARWRAVAVDG